MCIRDSVWGMNKWMGLYEKMVDQFADGVLASSEEMVMHMKIAGWQAPVYNVSGLAFGKNEVRSRVDNLKPFQDRVMRVGFAARWDQEKSPNFFMDLIEAWNKDSTKPKVEFALFSGAKLKSNDDSYMPRTKDLQDRGLLTVYEDLEKNDYYALLNDTRVLFNCALQDWVSNTVSEADTLGCNVLYPAYRSFPETFSNDPGRLYIPWSLDDAIAKLSNLIEKPHTNLGKISDWTDGCIDRILDILEGKGEQWNRSMSKYRQFTIKSKY
jgi:hypothetical protein